MMKLKIQSLIELRTNNQTQIKTIEQNIGKDPVRFFVRNRSFIKSITASLFFAGFFVLSFWFF